MTEHNSITTADGIPVGDNQNSLTAGDRGPILMQDFHLMEKPQQGIENLSAAEATRLAGSDPEASDGFRSCEGRSVRPSSR